MTMMRLRSEIPRAIPASGPVAAGIWLVVSGSGPCIFLSCYVGRELELDRCGLALGAVINPGGIAGDVAPFVDGCDIEFTHRSASLLVDIGDLDIVILGTLATERFQLCTHRDEDVLLVLR